MTLNRNLLSEAVRYSLTAGAVGLLSLASAPAFAQDTTGTAATTDASKTKTLEKVEVTGSRIKRVDQEGPQPITILKRADLEVSGNISVADVLRSTTFNSFGSFQQTSGSTAQSQSTISLRGLGSKYTLILIDGRRIAGSPVLGAQAQNLNSIPFAAVDRIEILRDGASAIYGSDAVGGVINVILRKDYQGLNVTASTEVSQYGEPSANTASITGGVSSDRGNITFVVDHQERGIFFNRDRHGPPGSDPGVGLSVFGSPGSAYLYTSTDGSFSGALTAIRPDPRCPTALGSDPLFPNSTNITPTGFQSPYFCYFNYAATNANEASLSRESILVNGNFDITDNISAFARVIANEGSSFGRFAPTPVTNPKPTMSGSDPRNPFGVDVKLLYRNIPGGTRDNTVRDNVFDVLFGFKGHSDWFGGADWEVAAHHNHTLVQDTGNGYLLRTALQALIDNGTCDPFANPGTPTFNGCAKAAYTTNHHATSRLEGVDGNIGFDLFDIADRPVNFVTGYEWERDNYSDQVDAQTAAGNVSGTAGGDAAGSRTRYAVYGEAKFPVLANLNIDVAGRYDSYSDFGNTFNPSVTFEYRPLDTLLLRAGWSKGFRAPGLSNLFQQQIQSFNTAVDHRRVDAQGCPAVGTTPAVAPVDLTDPLHSVASPGNPCRATQFENVSGGNPNLKPEKSRNWSAGVVWNAMDRLSFSLDYYNIKLKGQIASLTVQQILNAENATNGSPFVIRNPNGTVFIINAIQQNLNGTNTDGWDFDGKYNFDTDWGTFGQELTYSRVHKFTTTFADGTQQTLDQTVYAPKQRAQLVLDWKKGDFSAAVEGDFIGKVHSGDGSYDIGAWTTWDVQAAWKTPWNGKVTMGVRNIGGRVPPLDAGLGTPFYNNSLYNWLGRVPYLRYSQDF
jgi:iron complex outermembrane receptor protein